MTVIKRPENKLGIGRQRPRKGRAQALVEFALVVPLMMLIICGVFDLGWGVYAYVTVSNAAREGARVASVNQIEISPDCNPSKPIEIVSDPHWSIKRCAANAAIALGVQEGAVSVSYAVPATATDLNCDPTAGPIDVGCIVTVSVAYTYHPITPLIGNILGPIRVDSSSDVKVERVFP